MESMTDDQTRTGNPGRRPSWSQISLVEYIKDSCWVKLIVNNWKYGILIGGVPAVSCNTNFTTNNPPLFASSGTCRPW